MKLTRVLCLLLLCSVLVIPAHAKHLPHHKKSSPKTSTAAAAPTMTCVLEPLQFSGNAGTAAYATTMSDSTPPKLQGVNMGPLVPSDATTIVYPEGPSFLHSPPFPHALSEQISLAKLVMVSISSIGLLAWCNRAAHRKAVLALRNGACAVEVSNWRRGWNTGFGIGAVLFFSTIIMVFLILVTDGGWSYSQLL